MRAERTWVSFIIPTINQVEIVKKCLDSLIENIPQYIGYEIILVDDGSDPSIQDRLKQMIHSCPARLLTNNENLGFSATVNKGVAHSRSQYICLLNNDIIFSNKHWLPLILSVADRRNTGVVGGRLLYPNGRIQHGGIYYLPELMTFDHEYRNRAGDYPLARKTREVLGVTGALMLVNRELWNRLGGMDRRFFIAYEDVDFCLRTWAEGWRVVYVGEAMAYHWEGYTRGNNRQNKNPYWLGKELEGVEYFMQKWRNELFCLRTNKKTKTESISREQALRWKRIIARQKHKKDRCIFSTERGSIL